MALMSCSKAGNSQFLWSVIKLLRGLSRLGALLSLRRDCVTSKHLLTVLCPHISVGWLRLQTHQEFTGWFWETSGGFSDVTVFMYCFMTTNYHECHDRSWTTMIYQTLVKNGLQWSHTLEGGLHSKDSESVRITEGQSNSWKALRKMLHWKLR